MERGGVRLSPYQVVLVIVDVLLILATIVLALAIRKGRAPSPDDLWYILDKRTGATALTVGTNLLVLYVFELYSSAVDVRLVTGFSRLFVGVALSTAVLAGMFYAAPFWRISRGIILLQASLFLAVATPWRLFASSQLARRIGRRRALIVGAGRMGKMVAQAILGREDSGLAVLGFLDDDPAKQDSDAEGRPVLGRTEELHALVAERNVDIVVVAARDIRRSSLSHELLDLKARGVQIVHAQRLYRNLTGRIPLLYVDDLYFMFGPDLARVGSPVLRNLTRLMDISLSVVVLLTTLPLLVLGALAVKLTSRGPVLYRQTRVGLNEVPYEILKLRTMQQDAEKETGAVMAIPGRDPRVTAVGRFLRRTRIDELPQLFNVLKGDMSLIGPRPERPEFVAQFKEELPYYRLRFAVKPGLTGWAQVNAGYASNQDQTLVKLQFDLYYIQEASLLLDLQILLKTAQTIFFRAGS